MELRGLGDAEERRHRRHALILTLLALIGSACHDSGLQRRNRETALRHDLVEMRKAIGDFRAGKHRGPHSLSELKTSHYLHDVPSDPLTGSRNWRVTTEVAVVSDDFTNTSVPRAEAEVIDVHSRATGKDANGRRYADY